MFGEPKETLHKRLGNITCVLSLIVHRSAVEIIGRDLQVIRAHMEITPEFDSKQVDELFQIIFEVRLFYLYLYWL